MEMEIEMGALLEELSGGMEKSTTSEETTYTLETPDNTSLSTPKYREFKSEYEVLKKRAHVKTRRKLTNKPLDVKYRALKDLEKGNVLKCTIARKYGVPPNTLSDWIKNKEKICAAYESQSFNTDCKRMRMSKHIEVETALYGWYKGARSHGIQVTGSMLKTRAQEFADSIGDKAFTGSAGWMTHFKEKYKIFLKRPFNEEETETDCRKRKSSRNEMAEGSQSCDSNSNNDLPVEECETEHIKLEHIENENHYDSQSCDSGGNNDCNVQHATTVEENSSGFIYPYATFDKITNVSYRTMEENSDGIQIITPALNEEATGANEIGQIKYSPQKIYPQSLYKSKRTPVHHSIRQSPQPSKQSHSQIPAATNVLEMCGKIRLFLLTNHVPDKTEGLDHVSSLETIISKLTLEEGN